MATYLSLDPLHLASSHRFVSTDKILEVLYKVSSNLHTLCRGAKKEDAREKPALEVSCTAAEGLAKALIHQDGQSTSFTSMEDGDILQVPVTVPLLFSLLFAN